MSGQRKRPPSIANALSIWGMVALVLAISVACNGPTLLGCYR